MSYNYELVEANNNEIVIVIYCNVSMVHIDGKFQDEPGVPLWRCKFDVSMGTK